MSDLYNNNYILYYLYVIIFKATYYYLYNKNDYQINITIVVLY